MSQNNSAQTKMNRGFALVFAIFLVIGLETVIAGSLYGMMRLQREAQRSADEMRLQWAADAVIERTIKLLGDYVTTTGGFPNEINGTGANKIVKKGLELGKSVTGGIHQDFDAFLISWFEGALKGKTEYQATLSGVQVSTAKIFQTDEDKSAADRWRSYRIETTAHKLLPSGVQAQPFQVTLTQEYVHTREPIFNLSVFCNDDCEISGGPNFDLQGPIFSNKSVYLMNDAGSRLWLLQAEGFDKPDNPEPYVVNSVKSVYFYFNRFMGRNYLLDDPVYFDAVPADYKFAGKQTPEIYPNISLMSQYGPYVPLPGAQNSSPPYFYYADNLARLGCVSGSGGCKANTILVQTGPGPTDFAQLAPPRPGVISPSNVTTSFVDPEPTIKKYYTPDYNASPENGFTGSQVSISSAFDPKNLLEVVPKTNPNRFLNPAYASGMIAEGVDAKTIPLGNTAPGPNREHALIEPCRTDPCDLNDPAEAQKFHAKADFKLTVTRSGNKSSDFVNFVNKGILADSTDRSWDYRNGRNILYKFDVSKLLEYFDTLSSVPDEVIIYFSHDDPDKDLWIVTGGSQLPKNGLTIATSGRLWIHEDYNRYSYTKHASCANGAGQAATCYCTEVEWDDGRCRVPSAAVFSDSFGVLSKEWKGVFDLKNFTFGYRVSTPLDNRKVLNNVMVNTALATGYLPSRLEKKNGFSSPPKPCTDAASCSQVVLFLGGKYNGIPLDKGKLMAGMFSNYPINPRFSFQCSDESYKNYPAQGLNGVSANCEYYEEKTGIYYVNPNSNMYQKSLALQAFHNNPANPISNPMPACGFPPGDGNQDGIVDGRDFFLWQAQASGYAGSGGSADFNRDGKVDDKDLTIWRNTLGQSGSPADCVEIRIPIFTDPRTISSHDPKRIHLRPAPPFPGVYFTVLMGEWIRGAVQNCPPSQSCQTNRVCPGGASPIRDGYCDLQGLEGSGLTCDWGCPDGSKAGFNTQCTPLPSPGPCTLNAPTIQYAYLQRKPLYEMKYSGGIENLINLQEAWSWKGSGQSIQSTTLRFLGTLSSPWNAESLADYISPSVSDYYRAPIRKFDYNEDLRKEPPPGTPDFTSIKRGRWSRKFDS